MHFLVEQVKAYNGPPRSIMIDVGTKDDFLEKQLKPENFAKAAASQGGSSIKLQLRMQVGLKCMGAVVFYANDTRYFSHDKVYIL